MASDVQHSGQLARDGDPSAETHLLRCVMLPCQESLAQLDAGGEAVVAGVYLSLDALVVVHQQLH